MKFTDIAFASFFLVVLALILVYYNYSTYKIWKNESDLRKHGSHIQAKITDSVNYTTTRLGKIWTLNYEFNVNNKRYTGEVDVPEKLFNATSNGEYIELIYLESNPQVSNVANNFVSNINIATVLAIDIIVVTTLLYIVFNYKS